MRRVHLGEVTTSIKSWNPAQDPDGKFTYLDLSSVDNQTKAVTVTTDLLGREAPSRARQLVQSGDVLVSTVRPNLNAVAAVDPALHGATASTGFTVLRPNPDLDSRYLFHWVRSTEFIADMVRKATGASYPAVSDRIVKESMIPLPPFDQQRRIAAALDRADALRSTRRQVMARLDALRQTIFIYAFGDPARNPRGLPMGTVGDLVASADYGTSEKSSPTGDIAVLRMNNITYNGDVDLRDLKYMTLPKGKSERYTVRAGDVLFNRTNSAELVGKTAVYRGSAPIAYAGYLVRLRVHDHYQPDYLSGVLNSKYGKATLRGMCKSIVGMANINAKEVQTIRVPIPSSADQEAYARELTAVRCQLAIQANGLLKLDELFASLQSRAFRGDL